MFKTVNPTKIAIIFDQEVQSGGGFQQGLNASLLASKINKKIANIHFFHTKNSIKDNLIKNGIKSNLIKLNFYQKIYLYIKTTDKYRILYKLIRLIFDFNFFQSFLISRKVDLVYFISPSRFVLDLNELNFIYTVWDLCHLEQIEFPEIKSKNEYENRELRLKYALPRAISIIVDSEYGKRNLSFRYNIDLKRVVVIPFEPLKDIKEGKYNKKKLIDTHNKYNIKDEYIFYPAQFWPHKNHIYILKSIYILEKKYDIHMNAIFAGGDKGNQRNLISYSKKLNIEDRIKFVGFISNKELISHYKNSLALVMPTFFGPTNIPPLEGFKLGTPVIYPDLDGLREQVKDAGLLIDLNNPDSLSSCINMLLNDKKMRNKLIKSGYKLSKENENYDRLNILNNIINDFRSKYYNFQTH